MNYDKHILNSHSITHIEAPKHVSNSAKTVDKFFNTNHFFGGCTVVKLSGNNYKELSDGIYQWGVSLEELQAALDGKILKKLLLSTQIYHKNKDGYHTQTLFLHCP